MKRTPPTPNDTETSTVPAHGTVINSTQNTIQEAQFALWDAHVNNHASTTSVI